MSLDVAFAKRTSLVNGIKYFSTRCYVYGRHTVDRRDEL
jgi:hypothetical protein